MSGCTLSGQNATKQSGFFFFQKGKWQREHIYSSDLFAVVSQSCFANVLCLINYLMKVLERQITTIYSSGEIGSEWICLFFSPERRDTIFFSLLFLSMDFIVPFWFCPVVKCGLMSPGKAGCGRFAPSDLLTNSYVGLLPFCNAYGALDRFWLNFSCCLNFWWAQLTKIKLAPITCH